MPDNNIPDFRPNRQIDPMALVQALSEKRRAEAQQQEIANQRIDKLQKNIVGIGSLIGQSISSLVASSKRRQENETFGQFTKHVAAGKDQVPVGPGESATLVNRHPSQTLPTDAREAEQMTNQTGSQEVPTAQMGPAASTSEYQDKLKALALQVIGPKNIKDDLSKKVSESLFPGQQQTMSNRNVPLNFVNETTGERRKGAYIQGQGYVLDTGEVAGVEWTKEWAPFMGTDPMGNVIYTPKYAGAKAKVVPTENADTGESTGIETLMRKAPKIGEKVNAARLNAFPENNKFLEAQITYASAAATASTILKAKEVSQVGLSSLGFHLARLSGSNSQLSDREREIFEQPLSLIDSVANKGYRLAVGDLSPKMKQDLLRLTSILTIKAKTQATKAINSAKISARGVAGRYWTKSIEDTFPKVEDLMVTEEEIANKPSLDQIFGE